MDRMELLKESADRLERKLFAAQCRRLERAYARPGCYRLEALDAFARLMNMAEEQDKEAAWLGILLLRASLATGSHEILLALYGEEFYFDPTPVCLYWRPPVFADCFEEDMGIVMNGLRKKYTRIWQYEEAAVRKICAQYYHAALWRFFSDLSGEVAETESFRRMKKTERFTVFFGEYMGSGEILWQQGRT